MTSTFYDVKIRGNVTATVVSKEVYHGERGDRYAFKAKTDDGRNLTRFVSKQDFDNADV